MKLKIKNDKVRELLGAQTPIFPKYTTQIMNLANQNSQATRPKIVGQMSDLVQKFTGDSIVEWRQWYMANNEGAIEEATMMISKMVQQLRAAINLIDDNMIQSWVEDIVFTKTFVGLRVQDVILKFLAEKYQCEYRTATPQEEAMNIDGVLGDKFVTIKPDTWSGMKSLPIDLEVHQIMYKKKKDGIEIMFGFET